MRSPWLSLLGSAITAIVAAQSDPLEGYAFLYFTDNTIQGEKIYLAASNGNNALNWTQVNNGKPILTSSYGTKGLRDPFLIRSKDGDRFFVLATDLSIGSGTSWNTATRNGSRYLEIWESTDLVNWSEQRHVLVSPNTAGCTWAPEAYYDASIDEYVVYWASTLYDEADPRHTANTTVAYQRMLFATTPDFVTFSEPQIWQDVGTARIDSTTIRENGTFYRFTKDEGKVTGCTDIIQERSDSLRATSKSWTQVASCIGKNAGTKAVEGPTVFKSNPGDINGEKYYLFVDEYAGRGYIPLETKDIAKPKWTISKNPKLPTTPRHGTVLPITAKELAAITRTRNSTSTKGPTIAGTKN